MADNCQYAGPLLGVITTRITAHVALVTIDWLIMDSRPLEDTITVRTLDELSLGS